jgi:transcriptional antiterminator RfaH
MSRWYVVNTQIHNEEKAAFHLNRQGFETYLPKYLKKRSHARKISWVSAPMFPRYLFVHLDLDHCQWHAIRSTIGVYQFICQGDQPAPLPSGIIEEIQSRENEQGMVSLGIGSKFKRGDKVKIMHGPMAEQIGMFDCADDQQRVFVLLDLMGRQVKVRLTQEAVAAYG